MNINECTRFLKYDEEQWLKRFGTVIRESIHDYHLNTGCDTFRTRYVLTHNEATWVIYWHDDGDYHIQCYSTDAYHHGYPAMTQCTYANMTIENALTYAVKAMLGEAIFRGNGKIVKSAEEMLEKLSEGSES